MNPEQQKQAIADVFHRVAANYDCPALRFFAFAGDRLADRLQPRPGWRVLDIACGTGAAGISLTVEVIFSSGLRPR